MEAVEKRQRDLELLRKSRQALDEGELVNRHAPTPEEAERHQSLPRDGDPGVMMYRGKAIRRPRGDGGSRTKPTSSGDVRAVLERLNSLYKDGLITKAEYDRKRSQILDRM